MRDKNRIAVQAKSTQGGKRASQDGLLLVTFRVDCQHWGLLIYIDDDIHQSVLLGMIVFVVDHDHMEYSAKSIF